MNSEPPGGRLLPFHLVYHERYDLNLGEHVFPAQKYRLIRERLIADGVAAPPDFLEPTGALDEDLVAVHDRAWIQKLKNGTLDYHEILRLEIPYSSQMVEGVMLATGGTVLAAERALEEGVGFNIGGGFHHAFPGHGEGFCAIHDVAVAIRSLQRRALIRTALVVDCDVHHGNGTAAIFAGDATVFTMSIHQYANYPNEKPPSTVDIHLADGAGDDEYLGKLSVAYGKAVDDYRPDLVCFLAGADPYAEDQLGGLRLTLAGLAARDRLVFEKALGAGLPVVVALAGGYAMDTDDTVTIHCNTCRQGRDALRAAGFRQRTP
jgi:acetoin utilization deacetylase AcuC-like enzyme